MMAVHTAGMIGSHKVDARFGAAYSAVVTPVSQDTPSASHAMQAEHVSDRRSQSTIGRSLTNHMLSVFD